MLKISVHLIDTDRFLLLFLAVMDRLQLYYKSFENTLHQVPSGSLTEFPRTLDHSFFIWSPIDDICLWRRNYANCSENLDTPTRTNFTTFSNVPSSLMFILKHSELSKVFGNGLNNVKATPELQSVSNLV